ncbi:MAG: hypothetical protein ACJA1A_002487 [Saprospiraceae bacterium]|jgi:hypothetical protein|tara:strand:+ start:43 stop:219 length:177 start_codon:yes stop_codon:yes gene_type:complete
MMTRDHKYWYQLKGMLKTSEKSNYFSIEDENPIDPVGIAQIHLRINKLVLKMKLYFDN